MKEKKKLSLPAWIFIGMLAGIAAGLIFAFAGLGDFTTEWIKPIGTIYVNLLKFLVVPVVLFSIADGVISLKDLKRVGSVGLKTFVYYMITTALAVVIGLVLVNLFKGSFTPLPSADLGALEYEAKEAPSVMQVIVNIFPSNLLQPMVTSDMLPVIVTAIFLGAGVLAAGEKGQKIAELINCMEEVIMKIMMMIIKFTPIGVFCLMTNVVAVNGADIIGKLALIIGVAYIGYIIHVVVVYGLSVKFLSKMSPIKFFKGLAPAMITAFTTTSSNATLPVNIECCNKMGAEPEISSFVLPLGATINMDGTAIYQAVCAVFIACCYGVQLTLGDMAMIVLTATLASVGTAGVSGAGMIMLAMVLTQVGLPVEGIAINAGLNEYGARRTGAEFQAMGDDVVQATIQEGLASDPSTQSYKLAVQLQQKLDAGQTLTNAEIGRLYQANVQAIDAEDGSGDLLLRAAEEVTQKGRVTNNTAIDILSNPTAINTLTQEAVFWSIPSIPAPTSGMGAGCRTCCSPATTATWTNGGASRATSARCCAVPTFGRNSTRAYAKPRASAGCSPRPRPRRRRCVPARSLHLPMINDRSGVPVCGRDAVFFAALFLGGARNLSSTFSSGRPHFC